MENALERLIRIWQDCTKRYRYKDIAIILFFSKVALTNLFGLVPISKSLIAFGLLGLIYLFLGLSILKERGSIRIDGIVVIGLTVGIFLGTLKIHPEYRGVFFDNPQWDIWGNVLNFVSAPFAYYFIRCQKNLKQLEYDFKVIAWINFIGNSWGFLRPAQQETAEEYNMLFGYQIAFPAILFLMFYLNDRKKTGYLYLSGLSIALGVFFGSRGCVLGYLCFLVIYMLIVEPGMSRYKLATIIIGCLGALVITSKGILRWIYNTAVMFGIESRTLLKLAEGEIADATGRDRIYGVLENGLKRHSIFTGYGAYGDRYLLNGDYYSHNMIYEILITFGLLFGTVLLATLFIFIVRMFVKHHKHPQFPIFLALISFSICRLMFSYSFWYEPLLGGAIGIGVTMLQSKKSKLKDCSYQIEMSDEDADLFLDLLGEKIVDEPVEQGG